MRRNAGATRGCRRHGRPALRVARRTGSGERPGAGAGRRSGRVRTSELREAAEVLGISEVIILDHPDGDLRWRNVHYLHVQIVTAIRRCRPEAVITFGGGRPVLAPRSHRRPRADLRRRASLARKAPPLYYVTIPRGIMREVVDTAIARAGSRPIRASGASRPTRSAPGAEPPTLILDVREWVSRKLAAIRCHRTQLGSRQPVRAIDEDEARRWLGIEHFRRAPHRPHRAESSLDGRELESLDAC